MDVARQVDELNLEIDRLTNEVVRLSFGQSASAAPAPAPAPAPVAETPPPPTPLKEAMREARIENVGFAFDVAFSSWMPAGANLTPRILQYTPKLIIFIHTDHVDETTHIPQTGTPEAFRDLPARYKLIAEWSITRPQDMFHEIWPDLSQNIEETRQVKIYADAPFHHLTAPGDELGGEKYPWENELDMILLALEAKTHLRAMGHQL